MDKGGLWYLNIDFISPCMQLLTVSPVNGNIYISVKKFLLNKQLSRAIGGSV
jgi:hypothetical protein